MPRHAENLPRFTGASARPRPARHARVRRLHELRRQLLTALLGVAVFLVSSLGFAYANLQGNIETHDVSDLLGTDRPTRPGQDVEEPGDPAAGQPVTLLLIGSDERADDPADDMRSDATMIVHISADRSRLEVVSIPRDTLVDIPSCDLPDGSQTGERYSAMFNSSFWLGGQTGDIEYAAACTWRTVEAMTGIPIDDFIVVDFDGFEAVVDSLGGVPMYIEEDIDDQRAELQLEAGCQLLDGRDALGYARARYDFPGADGSDLQRIGRQQQLVAAIAREALSMRLLANPPALYQFLDASTQTLSAGSWIGQLPTMAGIALSVRGIEPEEIRFATMPYAQAPNDPNRVVATPEAEELWDNLRNDRPIDADIDGTGEEATTPPGEDDAGDETEETTPEGQETEEPAVPEGTAAPGETEEETTPECTR